MIRIRTLQYSVKGCVFPLLAVFFFFFFVNTTTSKTVNFDELFEPFESFISIISIFLNLWIWMRSRMNQTYFECYEFHVNVVLILIATCTYQSMLNWGRMNQSSWILLIHSYSKFHDLWISKKGFIADLWFKPQVRHLHQNEIWKKYFFGDYLDYLSANVLRKNS